jgi:type I restriction enzyme S subunit
MKMEKLPFGKIFTDVSGGNTKVLKSDYLEKENGFYPVIDQGKSTVAGYTSNPGDLFSRSELPVVLFGDHTRTIKHVDFPFAMGADGVKVLKSFSDYDSKYLYHYLTYANVPHFGYDRHFKYLKRIEISVPTGPNSLAEQKRIAAILDKADAIRRKRQQALQLTDDFLRSTFLKMFGDPVTNPMGWDVENFGSIVDNSFRNGVSVHKLCKI